MRKAVLLFAAAVLAFHATRVESAPKTFAEVLAETRKRSAEHKKAAVESAKGGGGSLKDVFMADFDLRRDLADACERSGRWLTAEGSLYFEKKPFAPLGWKFEAPPEEKKDDPTAVRARTPELVARRTPPGAAAPDLVVTIDCFVHRIPTATNKKPMETYPFAGRDVVCSDVAALVQAHVDDWKSGCDEPGAAVAVGKKSVGIADWFASLVGKVKGEGTPSRREWYAWTGEPFKFLHAGGTFVATATYSGAAVADAKAVGEVQLLLKALQPVLK